MGRHSKKDTPAAPASTPTTAGPSVTGEQFNAQFNASRINGAAKQPQTADDRIAALKKSISSHRNQD